ncbi:YfdQ family protein [bacterium]|nr:YfdQ family protein [bacterium]
MDMSVYSNYSLALATLRFVKRVRDNNPELWKQIQAEAVQAESAQGAREQAIAAESAAQCL